MTFNEIVGVIQGDLNLTSAASATRIGTWVNRAYRRIASDFSIRTIERQLGVQISTSAVTGGLNVGRELVFNATNTSPSFGVQKILEFYNPNTNPFSPIIEVSVDELRNTPLGTDPVQRYAVLRMDANAVTVMLDCIPATAYNLQVDCLVNMSTLSGTQVPAFAEDFHDLLVYKGKQLELEKMEKYPAAAVQEKHYEDRLGEYRLYIALSNHQKIYSGKTQEQGNIITARI